MKPWCYRPEGERQPSRSGTTKGYTLRRRLLRPTMVRGRRWQAAVNTDDRWQQAAKNTPTAQPR
ncbi:MAG: hypothetical protein U1E91_02070 [Moraxella sp.]